MWGAKQLAKEEKDFRARPVAKCRQAPKSWRETGGLIPVNLFPAGLHIRVGFGLLEQLIELLREDILPVFLVFEGLAKALVAAGGLLFELGDSRLQVFDGSRLFLFFVKDDSGGGGIDFERSVTTWALDLDEPPVVLHIQDGSARGKAGKGGPGVG